MIFEMLRTHEVELMRYLPEFLAKDSTFNNIQASLSYEHEKQRQLLIDLAKQFFVETATWGLDDWEKVYGLTHESGDSYTARRNKLKQKIQGAATMTLANMNAVINAVVPTKDAVFVENVAPGVCRVDLTTAVALQEVFDVIQQYKPAHLTCTLAHSLYDKGYFYVGCTVHQYRQTKVFAQRDFSGCSTDGKIYIGGTVHMYRAFKFI